MKHSNKSLAAILYILITIICSCANEEESIVILTGSVRYSETGSKLHDIPVKLSIYDLDKPFDRTKPESNRVYTSNRITNSDGVYKFFVNRTIIPSNATYSLTVEIDSLIIAQEVTPCFKSSSASGNFSASNTINRDILLDFPAYLQVTFNKLNHLSKNRVRFSEPHCSLTVFETTLDRPDTTILEILYFQYFKKVDIKYYLLKENEEEVEFIINDVELAKNDTTKLTIEY